jgi:chloramphenicol 3-O phosphotransferase
MHHAIAAAASRGNNILADHVFVEKTWVDECAELFTSMNAYLIGLTCPLEVLEQREKDRKDRTLGQARLQYEVIHQFKQYDLELDTSKLTTEECAEQVIERLKSSPTAFKHLISKG